MAARQSRLVGRAEQWRTLTDGLATARGGRGEAVFVFGASGLGTTRLALEVGSAASAAGLAHARGRCGAAGPVLPYRPIAEALLGLLRAEPDLDVSVPASYRAVLGSLVPQWWAGADGPQPSPVLIGEGVLRIGALAGAGRGLVLVLEDLDDADPETLATAEYLVDQVAATPVLLVLTARDEHGPVGAIARAARQRGRAAVLTLRPLEGADVAELAAGFLDTTPAQVPAQVLDTLRTVADGSPLVIEELLQHLLDTGGLQPGPAGWTLTAPDALAVSLAQSIDDRLDQLDPAVAAVLETAALLGVRFPLSLVQALHDLPDRELLAALAGGRRLVLPDDRDVDWYRFRHPSFRTVILGRVTPASRRRRSAEAARLLATLVPEPREDWLQLSIDLLEAAGERSRAAHLLAEAGRAELDRGAAGVAVGMLDRAQQLLAEREDGARIDVVDALLGALAETGQVDRAFALGELVDTWSIGPYAHRRAEIHVHLAWIAHVSGRWADGAAQIARARAALAEADGSADEATRRRIAAGADAAAAYLSFDSPDLTAGLATAVGLAERTAAVADAHLAEPGMSTLSCQAWHLLGMAAREVDPDRSAECFGRVCEVADRHRLQLWRLYGLGGLAANAWLGEASTERLQRARDEAEQVGATVLALSSRAILALAAAMFGQWDEASAQAEGVADQARALRLHGTVRYALMVRAVAAGQRADRPGLDAAMDEMADWGSRNPQELALAIGLGRVFCALLEEDATLARAELARLDELRGQVRSTFFLSGHAGLSWLMRALEPDGVTVAALDELLTTPSGAMRWNRQFLLWSRAVAHGAAGAAEAAERDRAAAHAAGAVFPVAQALAQRLVAERAAADGWGEPAAWLRASEAFFQDRGIAAVASACRALLRRSGESVQQRRAGVERVPERMRRRGITVREYEVLELLRERLPNRAIAQRLSISARTVEKHVASGLAKLDLADRAAVADPRWWDDQTGGRDAFAG